ncbi:replication protein A 70 kDa DNA-binding subunit-like [Tachypleus tridentatus]|uniref:replication protein A 70 kDa DNA-binding subunit-like n=1 Tax=Tachypleus tridentatus TaxID=6853 RepID=UPI003FD1C52E
MAVHLSAGSVHRILNNRESVDKPVLQILGYKLISGSVNKRYRLLLSDGLSCIQFVMLATHLNDLIDKGELERNSVIRLDRYLCNEIQPRKYDIVMKKKECFFIQYKNVFHSDVWITILQLTVLARGSVVGGRIGNPVLTSEVGQAHSSDAVLAAEDSSVQQNVPTHQTVIEAGVSSRSNVCTSTPVKKISDHAIIHPISSLTPYQNRWTICARVITKTSIKTWNYPTSEGKLFSMNLLDGSGEIRAMAFNDCCDTFYQMIEPNKVYYISNGSLRTANKQFTSVKNDYEMVLTGDTTVILCKDRSNGIPTLLFNFVPLNQLEYVEKDSVIDVIGICKDAGELQVGISQKSNKEYKKRDIVLFDQSVTEMTATLWGLEAENFHIGNNPVIALKGVKVSHFKGLSLSALFSSSLYVNPDIKEAHILKSWYDHESINIQTSPISRRPNGELVPGQATWKTFAQADAEMLERGDGENYYTTKATVVITRKTNCIYIACPRQGCQKKVIDLNNGLYQCEKCECQYHSYKWRLLLQCCLADFTESKWVTCFHEVATSILNSSAEDMGRLKEMNEDRFSAVIDKVNFKTFIFTLMTKMELYNGENRLKTIVISAVPLDYLEYGKKLLADIFTKCNVYSK